MESELDLRRYWEVIKRRWAIIIFLPLIAALTSWVISSYFYSQPVYESTTTLVMGKLNDSSPQTTSKDQINYNEVIATPQMAKIFEPIIKSRNVEEKVINQLDLPLSIEQLDSKLTVNSSKDTDLIAISVTDSNAKLAANIANAFAENFSKVVIDIKKVGAVNVLDKAAIPDTPIKTKTLLNTLIAFITGLMCAIGLAFLLDHLDNSLKTSEEIRDILDLPVIGMVPYDTKAFLNSNSLSTEAYRTLRTNIQSLDNGDVKKLIQITSAGPCEGKSIIAANLAISLAQTGKKVLIMDANLRKPNLHNLFELTNEEGLFSILDTKLPGLRHIVQSHYEGLDVLTSGPIPSNPAEILASDNMPVILSEAKAAYDVVIIDSPPSIAIADASILAQAVDGVIFVAASGEVTCEHAMEAKEQLEKVEAKIIGVVLNKVRMKTKEYNYYYQYTAGVTKKKKRFRRSKLQYPYPSRQVSV